MSSQATSREVLQQWSRASGGLWELRHEAHGWGVRLSVADVLGRRVIETEPFPGDRDAIEAATARAVELLGTGQPESGRPES